jgi:outer membrane protein OmpA-like peptidoglycan-associated protein
MQRILAVLILFITSNAVANICGTDFQNFNPTTSGLDFATVHSSETLKPCILNFGAFMNYAANTLSYSENYGGAVAGTKANDRILGLDLSMGMGINNNWDVGVSIPAVLNQEIKDDTGVSFFDKKGLTEIKLNTKYRFSGDDEGGYAGVLSLNKNLIENNPFAGEGAGPTINLEIVADRTFGRWATALNLGYRYRSPGSRIANQPFVPLKDQIIYSAAGSYLFESWRTKLILEVFGASAAREVDYKSDRSLNSLEGLVGIKHDLSHSVAWHAGMTSKIGNTFGGPDWRVYTGFNWAVGRICVEDLPMQPVAANEPVSKRAKNADVYRLNVNVLFDTDSDVIKPQHRQEIDTFLKSLVKIGFDRMEIDGHTDSVGNDDYNLSLSRRRAKSVRDYVIKTYNIPAKKVTSEGLGETEPIADNGNYQGRQKNRRVEFLVWR